VIARAAATLLVLVMLIVGAPGQTEPTAPPSATASTPPPQSEAVGEPTWTFGATAYSYHVPDDREYVQPTFTADRDWLHLELRYNYEALDTASAWVGCNLSAGSDLLFEITPMLGVVFGDTSGVAPGYKGSLGWRGFELYSEGEYVIDSGDASSSFFYNWSELTLAPLDWLRFGLVTQRTRLYDSERDIQRGLLLGFSGGTFDVSGYVFNLDDAKPTFVLSFGLGF
jgi:hypothetical protein